MVLRANTNERLQLVKVLLLIIGIGLCVVGKKVTLWPLVTWPMYSNDKPVFPPPSVSAVELRVIDSTGKLHILVPSDLIPMGYEIVAEDLIEYSFKEKKQKPRDTSRIALVNLVKHALLGAEIETTKQSPRDLNRIALVNLVKHALPGAEIEMIQVWRLQWPVEPLALPPLDREHPNQAVLLGSFNASANPGLLREK